MKKFLALVLTLVMVFGCTSALAELTFTTGGTAGTYYAFGSVLAQYITNNSDVAITAVAGNGSSANIDLLDLGDAQLGLVQSDVANYAFNGIRFEQYSTPIDSFTALAGLYTEAVQLITCDPSITSVADLKGKNVSIGAPGSGVFYNAMDFLAAYDMTVEDINPFYYSFAESADALKDNSISAAFIVAGAPTPAVTELCTTTGAYLIGLDSEHAAILKEINEAYTETIIPGGSYDGIDDDVITVGIKAIIIANEDVTEDEAYAIVSTIFENAAAIAEVHAKGAELDLTYASECGLPYHAGAAKYFAEKGITVKTAE